MASGIEAQRAETLSVSVRVSPVPNGGRTNSRDRSASTEPYKIGYLESNIGA